MTYCLALRLHEGLVFLADTRTNAGVDNISTYRPGTWRRRRKCLTGSAPTCRPSGRTPPTAGKHWHR